MSFAQAAAVRTWLALSVAAMVSQLPTVPHVVAVVNMPLCRRSARGTSRALQAHASNGDTTPAPASEDQPLKWEACVTQRADSDCCDEA